MVGARQLAALYGFNVHRVFYDSNLFTSLAILLCILGHSLHQPHLTVIRAQ